jgi:hypothetical protein
MSLESWANRGMGACWWSFSQTAASESASSAPVLPREKSDETMKKAPKTQRDADMLDEYDFSKGERGKYAKRYAERNNVVILDPDIAAVFPDSASVNEALRTLVKIARKNVKTR